MIVSREYDSNDKDLEGIKDQQKKDDNVFNNSSRSSLSENSDENQISSNDLEESDGEKSDSQDKKGTATIKQKWLLLEDAKLKELVKVHGDDWPRISSFIPGRTRKQCRERWHYKLNPTIKRGFWTVEEDRILLTKHKELGGQWSKIAKFIESRTDNDCKNRYYSLQRSSERNGGITSFEDAHNLLELSSELLDKTSTNKNAEKNRDQPSGKKRKLSNHSELKNKNKDCSKIKYSTSFGKSSKKKTPSDDIFEGNNNILLLQQQKQGFNPSILVSQPIIHNIMIQLVEYPLNSNGNGNGQQPMIVLSPNNDPNNLRLILSACSTISSVATTSHTSTSAPSSTMYINPQPPNNAFHLQSILNNNLFQQQQQQQQQAMMMYATAAMMGSNSINGLNHVDSNAYNGMNLNMNMNNLNSNTVINNNNLNILNNSQMNNGIYGGVGAVGSSLNIPVVTAAVSRENSCSSENK